MGCWLLEFRNRVRVSRGARRGVSTSVRDDYFERRIDRVSSTTGGSSILNNRRIEYPRQLEDRSVPRFEYRYPQQGILVIELTAKRQQVSMREQSIAVKASGSRPKGKRPDTNKRASGPEQEARTSIARGDRRRVKKRQEATRE